MRMFTYAHSAVAGKTRLRMSNYCHFCERDEEQHTDFRGAKVVCPEFVEHIQKKERPNSLLDLGS